MPFRERINLSLVGLEIINDQFTPAYLFIGIRNIDVFVAADGQPGTIRAQCCSEYGRLFARRGKHRAEILAGGSKTARRPFLNLASLRDGKDSAAFQERNEANKVEFG